jgi:MerR family transcriptional regulator, copper efflux regulator
VGTYTIGEVAERSGFSASALRYYEGIGLVTPAGRTNAGYRLYDDHTLALLAFVARAKQLGCTLVEIGDLVAIWNAERCGPVQRRFHELVTDKIGDARRQIGELTAFTAQLRTAAAHLARDPVEGPCDSDCACLAEPAQPTIACTLDPEATIDRLADWRAVLEHARSRSANSNGTLRVELDGAADLGALIRLIAAEQQCCSFFSFALTVDGREVGVEVSSPEGTGEIVTALFGMADAQGRNP